LATPMRSSSRMVLIYDQNSVGQEKARFLHFASARPLREAFSRDVRGVRGMGVGEPPAVQYGSLPSWILGFHLYKYIL
jgi:hypothetical protein